MLRASAKYGVFASCSGSVDMAISFVLIYPEGEGEEGVLAYLLTCLLAYLLTCLLVYLLTCLLAYLLTCLLAYLLTCLLTYPEGEGEEGVRWVEQPRKIVMHYLRGWFGIDFVSIGVSALDIVVLSRAGEGGGEGSAGDGQGNGQGRISGLRALRALRALRLIKLVRIFRASRIFMRWENKFAINYTALEVAKCLVAMIVAAHWFGCFWSLQVISRLTTTRLDLSLVLT